MSEFDYEEVPATTPNFQSAAAQKLAELFPEAIQDGKVDVDVLRAILGEDMGEQRERFGLFWPGKIEAIRAAQTPTTATLSPDFAQSVNWEDTQNIFIEGDNLEVLKILQKHYYGKIKMIYIDPPYNTGRDFVYPDNYADPIGAYLEMTGQIDGGGGRLSSNTETSGRFHSAWLNMMYPRLKLARNLLADDGVIFISIDDNELQSLLQIGKEIFSEECHLGTLVWKRRGGRQDSNNYALNAEYIVVFCRRFDPNLISSETRETTGFVKVHKESGRRYKTQLLRKWGSNSRREDRPNLYYPIKAPDGSDLYPLNGDKEGCWRWSRERMQQAIKDDVIEFLHDGTKWVAYERIFEDSVAGKRRTSFLDSLDLSGGASELKLLLDGDIFSYPKSVGLIKYLVESVFPTDNLLVLDFFAGSGTTAHAVMQLNAEDGGNRRCISVQLPEPTDEKTEAFKAGYTTISEITRERIRRAGTKILNDLDATLQTRETPLDIGFRAYKLVDTNFRKWALTAGTTTENLQEELENSVDSAHDTATDTDLLTEVILKIGFSLTEKITPIKVAGLSAHSVSDGLVLAYLNEQVKPTLQQLRELVALKPAQLILLEDALHGDDELKTNLAQECRIHNIKLWTV